MRDKIMDLYWHEFITSDGFFRTTLRYENAVPLEPAFWKWFREEYMKNPTYKTLKDFLDTPQIRRQKNE